MNKVIGILGGMGPYATILFQENLFKLTKAKKDWDHIHTVVDNNTKIPSRSRSLLYDEKSPFNSILESCNKLAEYPVDIIAIPCNSAHYWIKDIKKYFDIPIITPINAVEKLIKSNKRYLVLGSYVTYIKNLYKDIIELKYSKYIKLNGYIQNLVYKVIEFAKQGYIYPNAIAEINNKLNDDIDTIILACTELTIISYLINYNVIDSSLELAKEIIRWTNI